MSEHYEDRVAEILEQVDQLGDGPECIPLIEEAIRLADSHADIPMGFDLRQQMVHVATFAGAPDKALVAFTWCLSQCDRNPEEYDEQALLWQYKWIAGEIPGFPNITREQIDQLMVDMESRYERNGAGLHAIYKLRRDHEIGMGDRVAAQAWQERLRDTERDWSSDCRACVTNSEMRFALFMGKDQEGIRLAHPLVTGMQSCAEVPHRTYCDLLLPLLRAGELDRAAEYHRKGYRMVQKNPKFIVPWAKHLTFLVLTNNLTRAIKSFERHIPQSLVAPDWTWRYWFFHAATLLLSQIRANGQQSQRLRMPKSFPLRQTTGMYDLEVLSQWFEEQLLNVTNALDKRNGNDYYKEQMLDRANLLAMVTPYSLDPKE